MKKIVHFSDLHVGCDDLGERLTCIIDNLVFTKEPARDYVVVITGDLVEKATRGADYDEAARHLRRMRDAGFTVLAVPGNHDYGTGDFGYTKYVEAFKRTFLGDAGIDYPRLEIIDGVAFIGLDSMAEELNWTDRLFAQGELGDRQLAELDSALVDAAVVACSRRVVYLHHHPFDPRVLHELKDSEALGEILRGRGNVDALLYGHNHEGKKRNGKWGIPRCYDAGTTTRKNGGTGHHRVIDLARDPRMDYDADLHGNY